MRQNELGLGRSNCKNTELEFSIPIFIDRPLFLNENSANLRLPNYFWKTLHPGRLRTSLLAIARLRSKGLLRLFRAAEGAACNDPVDDFKKCLIHDVSPLLIVELNVHVSALSDKRQFPMLRVTFCYMSICMRLENFKI